MQGYQDYLIETAKLVFIQHRAEDVENEMRYRFKDEDEDPIHVFSTSALVYLDWLKVRQNKPPLMTLNMTGIPSLRRFLLGLTADGKWEVYRSHAFQRLPQLVEKIRRVVLNENRGNSYAVIRPEFKKIVEKMQNQHRGSFEKFIASNVTSIWATPTQKEERRQSVINLVRSWDMLPWNTYAKAVRDRGIVARTKCKHYLPWGRINWNEEISNIFTSDMKNWKQSMNDQVTLFARDLHRETNKMCGQVLLSITSSSLAPWLKQIAVSEWNSCQDKILKQSQRLEGALRECVNSTYQYATTETDIRCMIAKINRRIFQELDAIPGGYDKLDRQRRGMEEAMIHPKYSGQTLLDKISEVVENTAKKISGPRSMIFSAACSRSLSFLMNISANVSDKTASLHTKTSKSERT